MHLVGPDGKLWSLSSLTHDVAVAIEILTRIYADRLAPHVDPKRFAERLTEVTEQRRRLAEGLVGEARSGALKSRPRVLP